MERVGIFKMNFTLKLKRIKKEMHKPASLTTYFAFYNLQ